MADSDKVVQKKITFSGVFDYNDFYEALVDVLSELGYDIDETDHKLKHTSNGLLYAFTWYCNKNVDEYSRLQIWIRCQADKLKEVEVDDAGKMRKMYQGDIFLIFKGNIVTDYGGKWEGNPYLIFLKGFFDKYLYGKNTSPALAKGVYAQWVGKIDADVKEVIGEMKSFLQLYRKG